MKKIMSLFMLGTAVIMAGAGCFLTPEKEPAFVTVVNSSSKVFEHVCFRNFGAGIWDTADVPAIQVDSSREITLGNPGIFDIKVVAESGDSAMLLDRQYVSGRNQAVTFTNDDF